MRMEGKQTMKSITFAGNIINDIIKIIPYWPEKGMLVKVKELKRAVGGSVCNTAIDLKTLDPTLEVKALGKVGEDDSGEFVTRFMKERDVDCSFVGKVPSLPTSFTDVMTVETTGERTFFNMHGADSALVPEDVDPASLGCDIFHLGYLLLLDGLDAEDAEYGTKAARLLANVRSAGIKTSLDLVSEQSERFARIVRPSLKHCDYVVVNEVEASRATGVDASDMRGMCEALLDLGVREMAVIHRPESSAAITSAGEYVELGSLQLPDGWIRGSVGAGDAFCAGMLYSIMKGMSPEDGMRLASCSAACNLAVPDSVSGAKSYAETVALDSRFPRRA